MAFSFKRIGKRISKPFRRLARGDVGGALRATPSAIFPTEIETFNALTGSLKGPSFPSIPPAKVPPPPAIAQARPPTRDIPQADAAEADTRALFRRRGRRSALLTPGRGAGARVNPLSQTGRG